MRRCSGEGKGVCVSRSISRRGQSRIGVSWLVFPSGILFFLSSLVAALGFRAARWRAGSKRGRAGGGLVCLLRRRAKMFVQGRGTSSTASSADQILRQVQPHFHSSTPTNPHPPRRRRHTPPAPTPRCIVIARPEYLPLDIYDLASGYRKPSQRPSQCPRPSVSTYAPPPPPHRGRLQHPRELFIWAACKRLDM